MFVLITYDIQDDRRRDRLAHLLEDFGTRVQKSVFECALNRQELQKLLQLVAPLVENPAESVRYYVLCCRCLEQCRHTGGLPLSREPLCYVA